MVLVTPFAAIAMTVIFLFSKSAIKIALPILFAAGATAASVFAFREKNGKICCRVCEEPRIVEGVPCLLSCVFTAPDGEGFRLVDYASAGKDWQTTIAAWLPVEPVRS